MCSFSMQMFSIGETVPKQLSTVPVNFQRLCCINKYDRVTLGQFEQRELRNVSFWVSKSVAWHHVLAAESFYLQSEFSPSCSGESVPILGKHSWCNRLDESGIHLRCSCAKLFVDLHLRERCCLFHQFNWWAISVICSLGATAERNVDSSERFRWKPRRDSAHKEKKHSNRTNGTCLGNRTKVSQRRTLCVSGQWLEQRMIDPRTKRSIRLDPGLKSKGGIMMMTYFWPLTNSQEKLPFMESDTSSINHSNSDGIHLFYWALWLFLWPFFLTRIRSGCICSKSSHVSSLHSFEKVYEIRKSPKKFKRHMIV